MSLVQLVSQLLCPLVKEKRKSCLQNVFLLNGIIFHFLLLNWHLQINSLVLPPCSLDTLLSIKHYHETKLIYNQEIFKKVWKKLEKILKKTTYFVFKNFFDWLDFLTFVKTYLPCFLLVMPFLDYQGGLQKIQNF